MNELLETSNIYKTKKGYIAYIKISVDGCILWTTIYAPRKRDVIEKIYNPCYMDDYLDRRNVIERNGQPVLMYKMTDNELIEFCKKHGGQPRDYKK